MSSVHIDPVLHHIIKIFCMHNLRKITISEFVENSIQEKLEKDVSQLDQSVQDLIAAEAEKMET